MVASCVLAVVASHAALGSEDAQKRRSSWFPTYTDRSEAPEMWDGIGRALRQAGVSQDIATVRARPTAMWSAHVELRSRNGEPSRRAVVGNAGPAWTVLCVTSEVEDCSRYNP